MARAICRTSAARSTSETPTLVAAHTLRETIADFTAQAEELLASWLRAAPANCITLQETILLPWQDDETGWIEETPD